MPGTRIVRLASIPAAGLILLAAAGCRDSTPAPGAPVAWDGQTAVAQAGRMLQAYRKGLKPPARGAKDARVYQAPPVPPPRGIKDLQPMARGFPLAVAAIRDGDVLLYWNTDLSEAPDAAETVLAYAKEAPDGGGEALMRDGSTRRMTAAEFRAARKPEGAKVEESPAPKAQARR